MHQEQKEDRFQCTKSKKKIDLNAPREKKTIDLNAPRAEKISDEGNFL